MNFIDSFLSYWEAGELTQQPGSDKLFYRSFGGFNFQFRRVGYKQRTALLIQIASLGKDVAPLIDKATVMLAGKRSEIDVAKSLLPQVIEALARPGLQATIDALCATVSCDPGIGRFDPLSSDPIGEAVFGKDLTLQIPVALTAAQVNLDDVVSFATAED